MKNLILLMFVLFSGLVYAQTEYREGYIIKQNKDTVFGEIDYRSDVILNKTCKFKKEGVVTKYKGKDIIEYRFTDGRCFVSKVVNREAVFLELLVRGELNVYYSATLEFYFLENDKKGLTKVSFQQELIERDGSKYLQRPTDDYAVLQAYTLEAPELTNEIKSMPQLDQKDIVDLASKYHYTVCKTEECIVYVQKKRKPKFYIEIQGGAFKYLDSDEEFFSEPAGLYAFQGGVILHTSIPSLGNKWYYKTGVLGFQVEDDTFIMVPLHMEYIHYKGVFRPKFSYGINFLIPGGHLTSLNAGFNIKASEKLFVNTSVDFLFSSQALILPKDLLRAGVNVGLMFKL